MSPVATSVIGVDSSWKMAPFSKVGAAWANRNYYFKGLIGDVRVYNRALTPLEIQRIYLATKWRYV